PLRDHLLLPVARARRLHPRALRRVGARHPVALVAEADAAAAGDAAVGADGDAAAHLDAADVRGAGDGDAARVGARARAGARARLRGVAAAFLRRAGVEGHLLAVELGLDASDGVLPAGVALVGDGVDDAELLELDGEELFLVILREEHDGAGLLGAGPIVPVDDEVLVPLEPGFGADHRHRDRHVRILEARRLELVHPVWAAGHRLHVLLDGDRLDLGHAVAVQAVDVEAKIGRRPELLPLLVDRLGLRAARLH